MSNPSAQKITVTLTARQWAAIICRLSAIPVADVRVLRASSKSIERHWRKAMREDK